MKRNTKQKLEDECDKFWSKIIKIRDRRKCRICGSGASDSHHISGRSGAVVYDLSNGVALCRKCHSQSPGKLSSAVLDIIGQAEFDRLEAKAREVRQWKEWKLEDLKQSLKEIYDYYKTNYKDSIK